MLCFTRYTCPCTITGAATNYCCFLAAVELANTCRFLTALDVFYWRGAQIFSSELGGRTELPDRLSRRNAYPPSQKSQKKVGIACGGLNTSSSGNCAISFWLRLVWPTMRIFNGRLPNKPIALAGCTKLKYFKISGSAHKIIILVR